MKKHWQCNRCLGAVLLLIFLVALGACTDPAPGQKVVDEPDISDEENQDVGSQQDVEHETDVPDTEEPDSGPGEGYRLSGQLVPSGGVSMGESYMLSGTLSAGTEPANLKGASYRLTAAP